MHFPWKLYKTVCSGYAQHVLAKWHLGGSKFSKSWNWPQILLKTGKQCAFNENRTKRSYQDIRSTFWPNRTFERQSSQNRETVLKFSSKRENSSVSMKIVPNALYGSCAARFGQIAFLSVKVFKIVTLVWNSLQKGKTVRFYKNCTRRCFRVMRSTFWPNRTFERQSSQNRHTGLKFSSKRENSALSMKIVQNGLFRSCAARFGQMAFVRVKVLKIVTLAWNSLQNEKTVHFPWKLYKTLFSGHAQHVLAKWHLWGSKFSKSWNWPQILLKTGKQCAFNENRTKRSYQDIRSTFWPNRTFERQSSQNRETVLKFSSKRENSSVSMKIVPNALYGSCAARFGQIAFLSVKVFKIVTLVWNSLQKGKTVRFYKNCTRRCFRVMRSTFWPNRTFERQSSQNRHTGLKFSSKRENSALSMKIVQNGLFRSCAARFGQMAFVRVKVLKIVTLAWNSLQNEKTVHFPWKLYKTLFSGHAQHVLAKWHLWGSKFSKSWNWPEILFKTGKQFGFHENCTKCYFQVMRSTFRPNRIFERQSFQNRETGLKFSSKRENSALSMKIVPNALYGSCAARFGQIAFLSVKVFKIDTLVWNSLQKGKAVRFS